MQIKQCTRINKADAFKKLKSQIRQKKKRPGNSAWDLWLPVPTATSGFPYLTYCSNSARILLNSNYKHENILT